MIWCNYVFLSQCVHYTDGRLCAKPAYLLPFSLLSGCVSPVSVGLNSAQDVNKLLKISRILFKYSKILIISFCFVGTAFSLILFYECFRNCYENHFLISLAILFWTFLFTNCANIFAKNLI